MKNGGIIGPANSTSVVSADGVFDLQQTYSAIQSNSWPPGKLVTSNLECFLDATNKNSYSGTGRTWFDLSGNARNFTWNSTPSFTQDSVPYFSTLGNRCVGPASNSFGITNTSGYTVSLIFLQNSLAATGAFKFYSSNGSGTAGRAIFSHMTWSDDVIYFDQGGCCNADTRTSVGSGGLTSWNMVTLQRDANGSTRRIYKNASLIATNTNSAANINLSSTSVDLGSSDEYGGNSSTWNARLAGFLVYSRGLSATEISDNHQYFQNRFKLP